MNIKQLRYFCAVVEAGNANLAAQKLFVAPTAISMQLGQLEEILGGKLFDRSSRPMALTTLGEFFYPKARNLLSDAALLKDEAQGIAAGKLGWLSVGFVRSTFFSVLPGAAREFQKRFPKVRIDLLEMLSEHQAQSIRSGTIHIGLSRQIGDYATQPDMRHVLLLKDPLVAAVPIDHPLARRKSLRASDLDALPFICFPKDPFSRFSQRSLDYLRDQGAHPVMGYEAKEIHTALGLVAAGLGVTLVGRTVAQNNRTDVRFLPLQGPPMETDIFAVLPGTQTSPLAESFLEMLKQEAARLSPTTTPRSTTKT